jgi:acetylornithine/succinyldiaminopimelate/putrescine aminotransferase
MPKALILEDMIRQGMNGTCVTEVAGSGLLLGLKVPGGAARLKAHLLKQRILVGGSGNPEVLRLMPPLNLSLVAVSALLDAVHSFKEGN